MTRNIPENRLPLRISVREMTVAVLVIQHRDLAIITKQQQELSQYHL
jgi:hypothetical protein